MDRGPTIDNFNTHASMDSNTCVDPKGCARPMRPVLYVTDISGGLSQVGDWITKTPGVDPAKNNWDRGRTRCMRD